MRFIKQIMVRALTEDEEVYLGAYVDEVEEVYYHADTMMNDFQYIFKNGSDVYYNRNANEFVLINGHLQPRGIKRLPDILPEKKNIV